MYQDTTIRTIAGIAIGFVIMLFLTLALVHRNLLDAQRSLVDTKVSLCEELLFTAKTPSDSLRYYLKYDFCIQHREK